MTHWHGTLDAGALKDHVVEQRHALADAAKRGDWPAVIHLLDTSAWLSPNCWRLGGTSYFAPLHQAAWLGASAEVVSGLIDRGAWRTLRVADGRLPLDLATERGHGHLLDLLTPPRLDRPMSPEKIAAIDRHLAAVVDGRTQPLGVRLRHPSIEVLTGVPDGRLWYPVPGMYGGFSIRLREHHLYVESWCRVVGGSGEAHVITADGATLVDEGFV